MKNADPAPSYSYNALGQPTTTTQTTSSQTFTLDYGYDRAGNVTGITYPGYPDGEKVA